MDPYLTPASRFRAEALHREAWSIRADDHAQDLERAGNRDGAADAYMRSAAYLREEAAILRAAAREEGGTFRDLAHADIAEIAASVRDRMARELLGQ
jgi:hypothetical protein